MLKQSVEQNVFQDEKFKFTGMYLQRFSENYSSIILLC